MILVFSEFELKLLNKVGPPERVLRKECKSWVRQLIDFLECAAGGASNNIADVNNTLRSIAPTNYPYYLAGDAVQTFGVVVGTGTNPVTISDYNLQTQILHGNGAGQLYHQATTISGPQVSGSDAWYTAARNFNNNSGGTITVQEIGIKVNANATSYMFLLSRDLTGAFPVPTGKTLATQFTIKVTA